jgi:hypothetical protein
MARQASHEVSALYRTVEKSPKRVVRQATAESNLSATLMIDGDHYVVTGERAQSLRDLLEPYISHARRV